VRRTRRPWSPQVMTQSTGRDGRQRACRDRRAACEPGFVAIHAWRALTIAIQSL